MLNAVQTTAPAFEPVTLAEAQTHLIINGQDAYITSLIKASRIMVERYLNRSLMLQTWKAYADRWCKEFYLPYAPLLSVTNVKYYDDDAVLTTLATSEYWVSSVDEPGEIEFAYNFNPPQLQQGRPNAIEIIYTAGYSASATEATQQAAVPEPIKHAMKILMTDMHEHRGQYVIGSQANKLPSFVIDLIHSYKLYNF